MDKCLSGKHTNKNLNEKWKKLRDALKHSLYFKFSYSYVQTLITKIIPTRNFGFCWKIFSSLKRENQFLSIIIWNEKPEQCVAWEGGWWSIGEAGIRCHNIHLLRGVEHFASWSWYSSHCVTIFSSKSITVVFKIHI